jgi:hypothetical protein
VRSIGRGPLAAIARPPRPSAPWHFAHAWVKRAGASTAIGSAAGAEREHAAPVVHAASVSVRITRETRPLSNGFKGFSEIGVRGHYISPQGSTGFYKVLQGSTRFCGVLRGSVLRGSVPRGSAGFTELRIAANRAGQNRTRSNRGEPNQVEPGRTPQNQVEPP